MASVWCPGGTLWPHLPDAGAKRQFLGPACGNPHRRSISTRESVGSERVCVAAGANESTSEAQRKSHWGLCEEACVPGIAEQC